MNYSLKFRVGFHSTKENKPKTFIDAQVPGAVQLDYAKAKNLSPYYYADNYKDYEWMEDVYWTYKSEFNYPGLENNKSCWLVAKGIDFKYEIALNGKVVLSGEGMFTPIEINIQKFLKTQNELAVIIYPVPKVQGAPKGRRQAAETTKPAVSYGWDWHPRLIPSGIWDDFFLAYRPDNFIIESVLDYELVPEKKQAEVNLKVKTNKAGSYKIRWKLIDSDNQVILEKLVPVSETNVLIEDTISNLSLWWPHDHGEPCLYHNQVELLDSEQQVVHEKNDKVGFRSVELVMNDGAWKKPDEFPKSRSVAPAQLKINGRKIFLKGTNWVNPDIFFGKIDEKKYKTHIDLALKANYNVLRIWGGSIINKESFYKYCDEKGILVWQDFPLACNNYQNDRSYMQLLEKEATSIIKRLRNHVSVILWCGGNELFNSWSGMDDQSHALRLLNVLCYKYTPRLPFIATTPLMGMGHGHYIFRDEDTGEEVFQWMRTAKMTAYTEFGMPGPSDINTIKMFMPENEFFPPKRETSWETHHAFNAWTEDTWLCNKTLAHYFGPAATLEELIENGQFLQAEGLKFIYEEARRQKPYCAMALHWCFNEPWPTAANNSIINWPDTPKPAYYSAAAACRPVLASAAFEKFVWRENELFQAEIWLLNDSYKKIPDDELNVFIEFNDKRIHLLQWHYKSPAPDENIPGPVVRYRMPRLNNDRFKLYLEVQETPAYNSEYTLLFSAAKSPVNELDLLNA